MVFWSHTDFSIIWLECLSPRFMLMEIFSEKMGMEIILEKLQETQPCANVKSRTSLQHLFWT